MTTTKIKRNSEWNEWIVQVTIDGIRRPEADYHTDDKEDAVITAAFMEG